jgi:hypothetical protein
VLDTGLIYLSKRKKLCDIIVYIGNILLVMAVLLWADRQVKSIKAGLCRMVEEYKWISDIYYRKNIKSFVNINTLMKMLSSNPADAIANYVEAMKKEETIDYDKQNIIGDEYYQILCVSRRSELTMKRSDEILIGTGITIK